MSSPFRKCGACGHEWIDVDAFLSDPELRLLGLQASIDVPAANLLVFQHSRCGSTVSLLASRIRHLLDAEDPGWRAVMRHGEPCREECVSDPFLDGCTRGCVNAPDRMLLRIVQRTAARPL